MRNTLCVFLLSLIMATQAAAELINISNETYHVQGNTGYPDHKTYENRSSNPISYAVDVLWGYYLVGSSAGTFSNYAGIEGEGGQFAFAESTYTFTSNADKLVMDYYGLVGSSNAYEYGIINITLHDVSTSKELFNLNLDPFNNSSQFDTTTGEYIYSYTREGAIAFMPGSDEYRLHFSVLSALGEGGGYSSHVNINFRTAPVPEPATMLLFGTGVAGLAAVGRRKRS